MGSFGINHDTSWTTSSTITNSTITNGSNLTGEVISLDGFLGCLISIELTYSGTANSGAGVYVLKDAGGTYELVGDIPWGFEMPRTASTIHRRTFTVLAEECESFKIYISNGSGGSISAVTMKYKRFLGVTTA